MPRIQRGFRLFLDELFRPQAGTSWPSEVSPSVQLISPWLGQSSGLGEYVDQTQSQAGWGCFAQTGAAGTAYHASNYSPPAGFFDVTWFSIEHNAAAALDAFLYVFPLALGGPSVGVCTPISLQPNMMLGVGPIVLASGLAIGGAIPNIGAGDVPVLRSYYRRCHIGAF